MSSGLYSGTSGLALGTGLYKGVFSLWGGASGLVDGFGGEFSPASLFTLGEQGAWYDPSDLTSMRQLSTGATAVTAPGDSVGFLADKRLMGGQTFDEFVAGVPNEAPTPDFDTSTGWTFGAGASITGGQFICDNSGGGVVSISGYTGYTPVTTTLYQVSFDVVSVTGSGFRVFIGGGSAASGTPFVTSTGQVTVYATSGSFTLLSIRVEAGATVVLNSWSLKPIPGNHATQATAAQRPTYGIVPATGRRNLSIYTEQFNDASWTKTGVTITPDDTVAPNGTMTADRLTCTGGAAIFRSVQEIVASSGAGRVFSVYAKADTQDFVQLLFNGTGASWANFDLVSGVIGSGGTNGTATITDVGNGWFRCSISTMITSAQGGRVVPVTSTTSARAEANTLATSLFIWGAQLENAAAPTDYQRVVSAFDVTEAGVASRSYLSFDGTDDGMLTGNIVPGTDKAQVFAGVRKLSDAARGAVLELSASAAANNGAILLAAPNATSATYAFESKGTILTDAIASSGVAAPNTSVLTGLGDIAGDSTILRVNGVQADSDTGDQGTGNYLTYPLYIGRRGGSSLPFNGQLYGLIVRFGANLPAATISQTETWMGQRVAPTVVI